MKARNSTCDYDGDTWQVTPNEYIINSIIPCNRPFINVGDLVKKDNKVEYTWENRAHQNKAFAGNIIGQIAIASSSLGNKCQQNNLYIYNDERFSYREFEEKYPGLDNKWTYRIDKVISNEDMRECIKARFAEEELRFAKLLELSMTAIDAPKTSILPNMDNFKALTEDLRNPYFFLFLPKKEHKEVTLSNTASVLNNQCKYLEKTLLKRERAANNSTRYADIKLTSILANNLLVEHDVNSSKIIRDIIAKHIEANYKIISDESIRAFMTEAEKSQENQKLKLKNILLSDDIKARFKKEDINAAVYDLSQSSKYKRTQNYIFDYYFESVADASKIANPTTERLVEDVNGEYKGMFKIYSINKFENVNLENKNKKREMKRLLEKFSIGISLKKEIDQDQEIEIKDLNIIQDGEVVATIFANSLTKNKVQILEIQGVYKSFNIKAIKSGKNAYLLLN